MKRKLLSLLLALTLCVGLSIPALAEGTVKIIPTGGFGGSEETGWGGILVDGWELSNFISEDIFYFSDFEKQNGVQNTIYYADTPASLTSLVGSMRPMSDYYEGVFRFNGSLTDEKTLPDDLFTSGVLIHVEPATLGEKEMSAGTYGDGTPMEYDYPTGSVYILEEGIYFLGSELIAGCSLIVVGNTSNTPTPDAPSSWAAPQVNAAIAAGIVPESLQSKYTQATTRAEFCALAVALYETVTGEEITERSTFSDTTDVNVEKMAALGVVTGVGDGKFAPGNKLTREQAATMLSRLADAIGKPLTAQTSTFADNDSISSWAFDAVGQMQATGIMGGVGDNTFSPATDYTREQSIITIMRLFDIVK